MTSRNWVRLFMSTLFVGGMTTAIVGIFVRWKKFQPLIVSFNFFEIIGMLFWLFGFGLVFSVLSQMGFFAYLTVHRFGLGIFKSVTLWNYVQIVIIAFALFDLVYLRYIKFAEQGESFIPYLWPAVFIFLIGVLVAILKAKQTNQQAFIPALFFMVVVTTVEWVPALRINDQSWLILMLLPLLACNAYQLLILHKLNEKSQQRRKEIEKKPS